MLEWIWTKTLAFTPSSASPTRFLFSWTCPDEKKKQELNSSYHLDMFFASTLYCSSAIEYESSSSTVVCAFLNSRHLILQIQTQSRSSRMGSCWDFVTSFVLSLSGSTRARDNGCSDRGNVLESRLARSRFAWRGRFKKKKSGSESDTHCDVTCTSMLTWRRCPFSFYFFPTRFALLDNQFCCHCCCIM